jgi:hypothetical protein
MVYFHTKTRIFVIFLEILERKMLISFATIWYILWSIASFYGTLCCIFLVICDLFPNLINFVKKNLATLLSVHRRADCFPTRNICIGYSFDCQTGHDKGDTEIFKA